MKIDKDKVKAKMIECYAELDKLGTEYMGEKWKANRTIIKVQPPLLEKMIDYARDDKPMITVDDVKQVVDSLFKVPN